MKVSSLAQQLLFTTTLIQGANSAGTAFVFDVLDGEDSIPLLVTNKHVALEPGPASFSMFPKSTDEMPILGQRISFTYDDPSAAWVGHPTPDVDVAAMLLAPFLVTANNAGKSVFIGPSAKLWFQRQTSWTTWMRLSR